MGNSNPKPLASAVSTGIELNSDAESVRIHGPSPEPVSAGTTRRGSRIVKPQPLKWYQRLAASVIYALIELVAATLRYRWEDGPSALWKEQGPLIFCIWHNRLPLCLMMYRYYAREKKRTPQMAAIVSASKDGGVVAKILEHFGVQPVRGSSSRRGPQALLELTTWAERGYDLAITPDGPRGPCYVVQAGAIALAQLTGRPLVPVCYELKWKIRLRSWDRFQIPIPFSRVNMRIGDLLEIPRQATNEQRELFRQELEQRLIALTAD